MGKERVRLSRLRDIGWVNWDPIGLLGTGDTWSGKCFADEYDSYLIFAAGQLRRHKSDEEVIGYLIDIEANHMGLGFRADAERRAQLVVAAMKADDELWTGNS